MTLHLAPPPIELEPRPCGFCGLTIDRHEMVDDGEGPLFFCADVSPDEMTLPELERRAELIREIEIAAMVRQMELDDPRDRWKHMGESAPPPEVRNGPLEAPLRVQPYRTPQVTADAFWFVVGLKDPEKLSAWLRDHPRDTLFLLKLLEAK
jgi:hypothetical protein